MTQITAVEKRINEYLEAVRAQLIGLSHEETEMILDDLREHIDTNMRAYGPQPSVKAVEAVLAGMDPPESFSQDGEASTSVVPKVSRLAIVGAILLPFGILMIVLLLVPVGSTTFSSVDGAVTTSKPVVAWWQWLLRFTILPLGMLSPFASTALGVAAISQIRASKGLLVGKPLALIVALFYPLLVLDAIVLAIMYQAYGFLLDGFGFLALSEFLALTSIIVVAIIDLLIVLLAWRRIR